MGHVCKKCITGEYSKRTYKQAGKERNIFYISVIFQKNVKTAVHELHKIIQNLISPASCLS